MRIVIDLDGTICSVKRDDQTYADVKPLPGAIEKIRELHQNGHYIIIHTARNMASRQGNLGKVLKNAGKTTLDWLEKYGVVYDEIYFGKPNGEIYIDDRAIRFLDWDQITEDQLLKEAKSR